MTYRTSSAAHTGTWLNVHDDSEITYRVDTGGEHLDFIFYGPTELSIGLSADAARRCQELFTEALAELHRAQEVGAEEQSPH